MLSQTDDIDSLKNFVELIKPVILRKENMISTKRIKLVILY